MTGEIKAAAFSDGRFYFYKSIIMLAETELEFSKTFEVELLFIIFEKFRFHARVFDINIEIILRAFKVMKI